MRLGRHQLSDAELIAILLKTGTKEDSALAIAKTMLNAYNGNLIELGKCQIDELTQFKGIGPTKAVTILAAIELGRRRQLSTSVDRPYLKSSGHSYEVLGPQLADLPHEEFWLLFLNQRNQLLGKECISRGGITATVVDAKIVFRKALAKSAVSIILMHNHPSGSLKPSEADRRLTKQLVSAGKTLDIGILDHLIVGGEGYFSFLDEGLMS